MKKHKITVETAETVCKRREFIIESPNLELAIHQAEFYNVHNLPFQEGVEQIGEPKIVHKDGLFPFISKNIIKEGSHEI